ncbi:thiopeptide-type bacteriocin biosynthesis protein [Actinomadura sp. 7K507]|uniref:thiopeptide-type bacteriocin biosynthesis protein n=1 Tax=Actinomadura sp. 7K507 TaxID=2530365 RepID=UPI00105236C3|nr:thiopeptide-type bacteriocin biosynthesis protein [Actinomadura sp. 7K507]TDC77021.1 hypothetical protein E1285_39190 [Actinomadura sp. 7K507]
MAVSRHDATPSDQVKLIHHLRGRNPETSSRDSCPLRSLLTRGIVWTSDIYEPEVHTFGGRASMDTAHELFHADSRNLLSFLSGAPTGRRERSLTLCTAFMRGLAGTCASGPVPVAQACRSSARVK